jgi:hypothetical protein
MGTGKLQQPDQIVRAVGVYAAFVDILGFGAQVEQVPDRFVLHAVDAAFDPNDALIGVSWDDTMPIVGTINLSMIFGGAFGLLVSEAPTGTYLYSALFSDCFILVTSDYARLIEDVSWFYLNVVRSFIRADFISPRPLLRGGIGFGSFVAFRPNFETDRRQTRVAAHVSFLGTSVLGAYRAEDCGELGCRLFVAPNAATVMQHYPSKPVNQKKAVGELLWPRIALDSGRDERWCIEDSANFVALNVGYGLCSMKGDPRTDPRVLAHWNETALLLRGCNLDVDESSCT